MLLILLMILIDRFKHRLPIIQDLDLNKHLPYFKIIPIVVISLLLTGGTKAQQSQVEFDILKNDKNIGRLQIEKREASPFTDYQLSSKIEASFIKKFRVNASEKFRYREDKLIYSSVKRSINEKIQDPKILVFKESKYIITDGERNRVFPKAEINSNLVLLYFSEPIDINSVYCDNQQIMVDVQKIGSNKYRVDFPDGASNVFHYKDGECVQVDVYGKFFKVKLLKE
ncbi:MAG: DUF6134 family protein [Christiangramia sp.]|nr:DUF6134 family protein [Christiangramia sp.]